MEVEQGKDIILKLQGEQTTFKVLRIEGTDSNKLKVAESTEVKVELEKRRGDEDELVKKMRALKINDDVEGVKVDFVGFHDQLKDLQNLLQLKID